AVLGDHVSANVRLYADLSSVDDANPTHPVKLVLLGDFPAPSDGIDPLVTVKGIATIEFLDDAGNLVNPAVTGVTPPAFRFHVLGGGEMGISDKLTAVFGGEAGPNGDYAELDVGIKNSPDVTEVEVNVAGSLSIEGLIDAQNLVSAAGRMILTQPA